MATQIVFKTPDEIGDQYLDILKILKPEVDISKKDSDWWIRSRVNGGVFSGVYADLRKISDDAFPQSARREALGRQLQTYLNDDFKQPEQSVGEVGVTGTPGSVIAVSQQLIYGPNGNAYQVSSAVVLVGASGVVPVVSVASGQSQNLLAGAQLTFSSPPAGVNALAVATSDFSDGRDVETNEQASQRILERLQSPPAGGTEADYKAWARAADNSVVDVNIIRFIFGLGTVGVVITAGTTDIDAAVTAGDPVVRVPSAGLVEDVQDYIDALNPLTDCVHVLGPAVVTLDVSVKARYATGDGATIPPGQTLTQEELVQREVRRAIYKTPPGGRRFGSQGFVVASEIEEVLDAGLSAPPYTQGDFAEILVDRQVQDLSATGPNRLITAQEIVEPGQIIVESF